MSQSLTTAAYANAMAAYGNGPDPFADAAADMGANQGDYLTFSGKTGDWTYGKDKDELEHGSKLAVNMLEAKRGWICWTEGEVAEEIMIKVIDGKPPLEGALTDHGPYKKYDDGSEDGWSAQFSVPMTTDEGAALFFKTSSKSGVSTMGRLMADFSKGFRHNPGKVPVIEIGADSFVPKGSKPGSKTYAPTAKIVDWVDPEVLNTVDEDEVEGGEDPRDYEQVSTSTDDGVVDAEIVEETPPPPPKTETRAARPAPAPEPKPAPVAAAANPPARARKRFG